MSEFEGHTSGFEKQVLDASSNIPVDYNPKGWENLSKQLDVELPLGGKTMISASLKLWLISIGVSTVFVILLLTNYSGQEVNSMTKMKGSKSGTGTIFYQVPTPWNQEISTFPKALSIEGKLTKSRVYAHDSIMNDFSLDERSNQRTAIGLGEKKDKASKIQSDSVAIRFQPKHVEKDTLFIFW